MPRPVLQFSCKREDREKYRGAEDLTESGGKGESAAFPPVGKTPESGGGESVQVAPDGSARYGAGLYRKAQRAQKCVKIQVAPRSPFALMIFIGEKGLFFFPRVVDGASRRFEKASCGKRGDGGLLLREADGKPTSCHLPDRFFPLTLGRAAFVAALCEAFFKGNTV